MCFRFEQIHFHCCLDFVKDSEMSYSLLCSENFRPYVYIRISVSSAFVFRYVCCEILPVLVCMYVWSGCVQGVSQRCIHILTAHKKPNFYFLIHQFEMLEGATQILVNGKLFQNAPLILKVKFNYSLL